MEIRIYTETTDGLEICLKELIKLLEIRKKFIKPIYSIPEEDISENEEAKVT